MLIYLGGAMTEYEKLGKLEEAVKWRIAARNKLKEVNDSIKVFDPTFRFSKNLRYSDKSIVLQNIHYLEKSDLLIVNLEHLEKSPGTQFEIAYAYSNNKPIIAFGENEIYYYPHLKVSITERLKDVDSAIEYINNLYYQ